MAAKGNSRLSDADLKNYRAAFDMCDKNRDKTISIKELTVAMKRLGLHPSEKEVRKIVKEVDKNSDEKIDFNEFCSMVAIFKEIREVVDTFRKAFQAFDANRDGFISRDELRNAMKAMGEKTTDKELDEMIALADVNKDGKVNYEEFATMYSMR